MVCYKDEMVAVVAKEVGCRQSLASEVIDSLLRHITDELSKGNKVQFVGFGVFEPKYRAERTGRNPHTKEPVPIPARVIPSFKPGSRLKSAVERAK